ncbi:hypothetical protein [Eggerthella guodeyinii]|uniref:Uncharacterized protein n=1 Tax=Eggerthella guodeyinii TaxID=2690837 RepID=A0A6N7RK62_9ACTN|nr:hypothetical protein [Eggerthella guodeyinii]MRX81639.1 hypothetical protein [Eggerthella guodeyinii]
MNEGCAVFGTVCSASPPRQSAVSRVVFAVGVVFALSLALLLGFAPKAWADSKPNYQLIYSSSQKATISWSFDLYKGKDNTGVYSVNQTANGVSSSWQYKQDRTGSLGLVDASGNAVPALYNLTTFGKPFSLYVDGVKVASDDTGGAVSSLNVSWDGMMDFRTVSGEAGSDAVYGNLDLRIYGFGRGIVGTQDYYRPMGTSDLLGSSWNLLPGALEQGTTGVYDGGTHNIELVLYERIELPTEPPTVVPDEFQMKTPAISLKYDDGSEYEEGVWTNRNVFVEADTVEGDYLKKFYIILFEGDSCVQVARSGWATLPYDGALNARYVVSKSTPLDGMMYFGGLFGEGDWPTSPKSLMRLVKVDKEKPIISSISISGRTPVVSASDALSGVASIEGRTSASGEWSPIDTISVTEETRSLYVKVTDNAGNSETRMFVIPTDPDPDTPPDPIDPDPGTPPDGGDDSSGRGDGFKMQRAA